MTSIRRHTLRLPDDLRITLLRLRGPLTAAVLRAMLAVDWYVLLGATTSPDGTSTGYGAYVGTSDALRAQTIRAGVSLRTWTYKHGRLRPDTVVLIRRTRCPVSEQPRLLVEARMAQAIAAAGFTVLNLKTAAPTAAARATRRQRLWANEIADRLARVLRGRILHAHPPTSGAVGGNTREQLVRLARSQDPPRGMDIRDLLQAAHHAGLRIAGAHPAQRCRRDVTTRERSGRPRLYCTWVNGRTVVYPAGMSVRTARATYRDPPLHGRCPPGFW